VSDCSTSDTRFLPVGCAGGTTAAAKGTASRIAADVDVGSVVDIPRDYTT
jgi:hypothetical protein